LAAEEAEGREKELKEGNFFCAGEREILRLLAFCWQLFCSRRAIHVNGRMESYSGKKRVKRRA
jgi:hypothetical protein